MISFSNSLVCNLYGNYFQVIGVKKVSIVYVESFLSGGDSLFIREDIVLPDRPVHCAVATTEPEVSTVNLHGKSSLERR